MTDQPTLLLTRECRECGVPIPWDGGPGRPRVLCDGCRPAEWPPIRGRGIDQSSEVPSRLVTVREHTRRVRESSPIPRHTITPAARTTDPDTSHQAARIAAPTADNTRGRALLALADAGHAGLTDFELADRDRQSPNVDRCAAQRAGDPRSRRACTSTSTSRTVRCTVNRVALHPGRIRDSEGATRMILDASAVDLVRRILPFASRDRASALDVVRFDGDAAVATDSYRMGIAWFDGEPVTPAAFDAAALRGELRAGSDWVCDLSPNIGRRFDWRKIVNGCRWQWSVRLPRGETIAALTGTTERIPDLIELRDDGTVTRSHYRTSDGAPRRGLLAPQLILSGLTVVGDPPGSVWCSGFYLRQALMSMRGDTVLLDLDDGVHPIVMREPGLSHLLMPVRMWEGS